jgi:hypothetical protein
VTMSTAMLLRGGRRRPTTRYAGGGRRYDTDGGSGDNGKRRAGVGRQATAFCSNSKKTKVCDRFLDDS